MENVSPLQKRLLGQLEQFEQPVLVRWDDARGVAGVIRGALTPRVDTEQAPAETVRQFLADFGALFGPPELLQALRPPRIRTDNQGRIHLDYQQELRVRAPRATRTRAKSSPAALAVYGATLAAHVGPDGELYEVQSSCWRDIPAPEKPRITLRALRASLTRNAARADDFEEVCRRMQKQGEKLFPIMDTPRLVLYPWQKRFRPAWATYAYQSGATDAEGGGPSRTVLEFRQLFVDAVTGAILLSAPMTMHAETPVVGTGIGVTPPAAVAVVPVLRALNMVRINAGPVHELKDTTHARDIVTYDLAGGWQMFAQLSQLGAAAVGGTLPVSTNQTGNAWTVVAPDAGGTDAERLASQQPEVDAHFFGQEVYEWYDALAGGRAGWDDGQYSSPPVPAALPIRITTHVVTDTQPVRLVDAFCQKVMVGGYWQVFMFFGDGNPNLSCAASLASRSTTFWAGSKNVVGHEYQHAITGFSFHDDGDNPGLPYRFWGSVVHEGLSDVFGCFFSDIWRWGPEISPAQLVFRNAEYPRDTLAWGNQPGLQFPCSLAYNSKDHFADQSVMLDDSLTDRQDVRQAYRHGTILAHCAFLMGVGGVHQRLSRTPALIPVDGMGTEVRSGKEFRKAARMWYEALTAYLGTVSPPTGDFRTDAAVFSRIREGLIGAITAPSSYGTDSVEHRTAELAFYAVGIRPLDLLDTTDPYYGADVTFLPWGWSWRQSRPYLGGIHSGSPDWSSLDLFINNGGGASGWNAVIDTAGNPTPFENQVYCRVRNVGDMDAAGVSVTFWYAKVGPAPVVWQPMLDKNGVAQTLDVGTLGAGEMTFDDTAAGQASPPASAMVRWHIAPLAPGEVVGHFCIRAVASAVNDVNPHNNTAQSHVAYASLLAGPPPPFRFAVERPPDDPGPIEFRVDLQLPAEWRIEVPEGEMRLEKGRERVLEVRMVVPERAHERIDPPFDGALSGQLSGPLSGEVHGALTECGDNPGRLSGRAALALGDLGTLVGRFDGRLDVLSGRVRGRISGEFQNAATGTGDFVGAALDGTLAPWRRINVAQVAGTRTVGGFTIELTRDKPPAIPPPPSKSRSPSG